MKQREHPAQEAPQRSHPGEVVEIESEEELDALLAADSASLTCLLASLTWCRPCKTLAKPLQVRSPWHSQASSLTTARAGGAPSSSLLREQASAMNSFAARCRASVPMHPCWLRGRHVGGLHCFCQSAARRASAAGRRREHKCYACNQYEARGLTCQDGLHPTQELAKHYDKVGFVKMYGNVSEAAKHLFKNRLMARVTPTFYFFRGGAAARPVCGGVPGSLASRQAPPVRHISRACAACMQASWCTRTRVRTRTSWSTRCGSTSSRASGRSRSSSLCPSRLPATADGWTWGSCTPGCMHGQSKWAARVTDSWGIYMYK